MAWPWQKASGPGLGFCSGLEGCPWVGTSGFGVVEGPVGRPGKTTQIQRRPLPHPGLPKPIDYTQRRTPLAAGRHNCGAQPHPWQPTATSSTKSWVMVFSFARGQAANPVSRSHPPPSRPPSWFPHPGKHCYSGSRKKLISAASSAPGVQLGRHRGEAKCLPQKDWGLASGCTPPASKATIPLPLPRQLLTDPALGAECGGGGTGPGCRRSPGSHPDPLSRPWPRRAPSALGS